MTFAVLGLDRDSATLAADGQVVLMDANSSYKIERGDKIASGPALAGVLAGITQVGERRLYDGLVASVSADVLVDAAHLLIDAAAEVYAPHIDAVLARVGEGEVAWEAVLVARTVPRTAVHLTVWRKDSALSLSARELTAADGRVVVALGAQHPWLVEVDYRHHESYADRLTVARLTRQPEPVRPAGLAGVLAESVPALITGALAHEDLAPRPAGWPAGVPVAAGPVAAVSL